MDERKASVDISFILYLVFIPLSVSGTFCPSTYPFQGFLSQISCDFLGVIPTILEDVVLTR